MSEELAVDRHRRYRLYTATFALLVIAGGMLRIVNLGGVIQRSPDERTYAWESSTIADHGEQGFRSIVNQFQKDPALLTWPSPARAGYLWILSWVVRVSGHRDAMAGAILSCIADIGALVLLGMIGWRLFSPQVALAAMLLYAVSPPVLAMARRSWQESFVEFLALLLIFFSLEAMREKRSWYWIVAAGVLAGFSLTIKEIAVVYSTLVLVLLGIALIRRRERRRFYLLAASAVTSEILWCVWLAHVLGSFATFISFTRQGVAAAGSSAYAVVWESGSIWGWFSSLWMCDPVIFTLGVAGVVIAFRPTCKFCNSAERYALLWSSLIVLTFLVLPVLSSHHLNVRFICPLFGPLCLLAGTVVQAIASALQRSLQGNEGLWTRRFLLAALLFAAFINYRAFEERFVRTDLQDLSFRMIQGALDRP